MGEGIYLPHRVRSLMQRLLATTMMLLMMTAALAGCAGDDDDSGFTQEDIDTAREEGRAAGIAEATTPSTLDVIMERGSMKCGVKESQYGMGYLDSATGVRSGLDISYCRAVAAALGLNPDTDVEYIPASGSDRFEKLASGTIDVLIRTTTWTTSRDADLNADFAGMNFFDGQGILVRGTGTQPLTQATRPLVWTALTSASASAQPPRATCRTGSPPGRLTSLPSP